MILALRTDTSDTELYLVTENGEVFDEIKWHAGKELSVHLLSKITVMLKRNELLLNDVNGYIVYEGPGSFTGLRIGVAVMNTLAYGFNLPIAGSSGERWIEDGISKMSTSKNFTPVQPQYGAEPHITQQKK